MPSQKLQMLFGTDNTNVHTDTSAFEALRTTNGLIQ